MALVGNRLNTTSMVEAAFAKVEELIARVEELTATFQLAQERRERRWVFDQQTVPAGATSVDVTFQPPPGIEWIVERVATTCPAGGTLAAFLDTAGTGTNLVDSDAAPQSSARALSGEGIHVPAGSPLIYRFSGRAAGDVVTVRLRLIQLGLGL